MMQLEDRGRRVIFALAWQYLNAKQARELVVETQQEGLLKLTEMSEQAMFNLLGQTLAKYGISYRWLSEGRGNYRGITLVDSNGSEIEHIDLYQEGDPWEGIRRFTKTPVQIMQSFKNLLDTQSFEQTDFDPEG